MQLQVEVTALEMTAMGEETHVRATYYDPFNEIEFTVTGFFSKDSELPQLHQKFTIDITQAVPLVKLGLVPTPIFLDGV